MPVRNKLTDLNDHLFAELESLRDDSLTDDAAKMDRAIARSRAVCDLAGRVIEVGNLAISAMKVMGPESGVPEGLPLLPAPSAGRKR